eukprot:COSAG02_NODE_702_length_18327_cov_85.154597_17_plen_38_part_00
MGGKEANFPTLYGTLCQFFFCGLRLITKPRHAKYNLW